MWERVRCRVMGKPCPVKRDEHWYRQHDPTVLFLRQQKHEALNAATQVKLRRQINDRKPLEDRSPADLVWRARPWNEDEA